MGPKIPKKLTTWFMDDLWALVNICQIFLEGQYFKGIFDNYLVWKYHSYRDKLFNIKIIRVIFCIKSPKITSSYHNLRSYTNIVCGPENDTFCIPWMCHFLVHMYTKILEPIIMAILWYLPFLVIRTFYNRGLISEFVP